MNLNDNQTMHLNSSSIAESEFLPYKRKYRLTYHMRYGFMGFGIALILLFIFFIVYAHSDDAIAQTITFDEKIHYGIIALAISYIFTWLSCIGWKLNDIVMIKILENFSSRTDLLEFAKTKNQKDNVKIILCAIFNVSIYYTVILGIILIVGAIATPFIEIADCCSDDKNYVAKDSKNKKVKKIDLNTQLEEEVKHPNLVYDHI